MHTFATQRTSVVYEQYVYYADAARDNTVNSQHIKPTHKYKNSKIIHYNKSCLITRSELSHCHMHYPQNLFTCKLITFDIMCFRVNRRHIRYLDEIMPMLHPFFKVQPICIYYNSMPSSEIKFYVDQPYITMCGSKTAGDTKHFPSNNIQRSDEKYILYSIQSMIITAIQVPLL